MMALRTLLLCGVIWAHLSSASAQNGGLPVAQPLMKSAQGPISGCMADTECLDNHYCGGRGLKKRCIECYDCAKVKRSYKIAYDGKACARQQSDCGECNPGYTEAGGSCLLKEAQHDASVHTTQAVGGFNSLHQANEEKNAEVAETAALSSVAMAILSVVVIFVALILIIVGICSGKAHAISTALRPKTGGTQQSNEEEAQPFTYPWFNQASAPPQEYGPQPPYLPNDRMAAAHAFFNNSQERLINEKGQQALPFDRGNGGSVWGITNEDNVQIPDETDGNPTIPPQPQSTTNSNTNNGNAHAHGSLPRQSFRRSFPNQRTIAVPQPRSSPPSQGIGAVNPRNNGFPPPPPRQNGNQSDAVVGYVLFNFQAGFANYSWQNNDEDPVNSPGMAVASAPNSPRAGRIDDSFVFLNNTPAQFINTSVDSGTGTGDEHDQTVPSSRSISGSDVRDRDLLDVDGDDSLFQELREDDTSLTSTRASAQPQRQVVAAAPQPIQNQGDAAAQLQIEAMPMIVDFARYVEDMDGEDYGIDGDQEMEVEE